MSLVLLLGLFAVYALAMRPVLALPMSPGWLLAAQIALGSGALIVPLWVYSIIDRAWWKANVTRVARDWCASAQLEFKRAELHKNHFAAVYLTGQKSQRRRFTMSRQFLVWRVKRIEWLDEPPTTPARNGVA